MNNEQYLAGCILLEETVIFGLADMLTGNDFADRRCRVIFEAASDLMRDGSTVDAVSIRNKAAQKNVDLDTQYLADLMQIVPTTVNYGEYARRVHEDARTRRIKAAAEQIQADKISTPDELLEQMRNTAESEKSHLGKKLLTCAADIPYEPPRWVLRPYLQTGKGTLLQGDPGTGKTVLACGFISAITTGQSVLGLDVQTPGSVVILSVEDDLPVLVGRIKGSGGDLTKCHFFNEASRITITSSELESAIKEVQAKLIVFDPLQAFLGPDIDMFRANETRPALAKLFDMCDRNNCACLILGHTGKNTANKSAVNMTLGSVDIPASMRSVLHVIENPENKNERLAVHVKCSNAPKGKTLVYSINDMGGVDWQDLSDFTMEDLERAKKRNDTGIPYENEPLVQVFNQLITDRPGGGFWSYADLKAEGAKILGFPPFDDINGLRSKLDSGLAKALQKNDALIVTHSEKGKGNVRGVRVQLYHLPQGYQTQIQVG